MRRNVTIQAAAGYVPSMALYFVLFLLSGFASLVYEVVWLRLAMASFGVTTQAVSLVLAVFMAGLALGSWGAGRLTGALRAPQPSTLLRLYATSELGVAVSAHLVPRQLSWGRTLFDARVTAEWSSSGYYILSGLWIVVTLLPYCVCMGSTFPLAMAALRTRAGESSGRTFSYLYVANVVGAASGTLLSAFLLIELFGFHGTLLVTAMLNVLIAATAFAASVTTGLGRRPVGSPLAVSSASIGQRPGRGVLGMLFTTGFVSLAMEIVWVRQFTPHLGTEVYAFAILLALYLLATCLGSQAYRVLARRGRGQETWGAWLMAGLLGLAPLVAADPRLPLRAALLPVVFRVALGIGPFCAAVGFLTPMLVDRWSGGDPRRAGMAYAVNVVGGIVGPLVAGFVLLPWLGEPWALAALTAPLFGLGLWAARPVLAGAQAPSAWARVAVVALAAALVISATRGLDHRYARQEVRRDYTATVIAAEDEDGKKLLINGWPTTVLSPATKMMAHLPLAHLARPPGNALVICFGMGTTFRSLMTWGIPVTAVELVPSVPSMFSFFHPDGPALLRSSTARVVIDDGRRFLARSLASFDVITVDPPFPVEAAGSGLLYSREFNLLVKRRLTPEGIMQQWLPQGDGWVIVGVAKALRETFPHVRVFLIGDRSMHFLASMEPIPIRAPAELARRLPAPAAKDMLEWGPARTAEEMFEFFLRSEIPIELLIGHAPNISALEDDRPTNEYFLIRRVLLREREAVWLQGPPRPRAQAGPGLATAR